MNKETKVNDFTNIYENECEISWMVMQSISIKKKWDDTIIDMCSGWVCITRSLDELIKQVFWEWWVSIKD